MTWQTVTLLEISYDMFYSKGDYHLYWTPEVTLLKFHSYQQRSIKVLSCSTLQHLLHILVLLYTSGLMHICSNVTCRPPVIFTGVLIDMFDWLMIGYRGPDLFYFSFFLCEAIRKDSNQGISLMLRFFYFPLIIFISFFSSFYFSLLVVLFLYVDCIAGC